MPVAHSKTINEKETLNEVIDSTERRSLKSHKNKNHKNSNTPSEQQAMDGILPIKMFLE
jgi:hypothetical protein